MKERIIFDYIGGLSSAIRNMKISYGGNKSTKLPQATRRLLSYIARVAREGRKIVFIGNGGSACIASHQAIDFWKNGRIKATAFNDAAMLTCLSNDFGYEYVFQKSIERFAEKGDILFAISSSGRSRNIINGVRAARDKGLKVITLSGFDRDNPLGGLGDINFYVPSHSYGIVEIAHLLICHSILDYIIDKRYGTD